MREYNPPRKEPNQTGDPLEIELVYNVRQCGTCKFFWPDDSAKQPYGPFPVYDFLSNTPEVEIPEGNPESYPWVKGKTREQAFPNPEVMDGCRKAPIMTIGINPNLTAFAPGTTGTSWAYPDFTSDDGTDAYTKYAYYYRYRSVYQERFELDFVKQYLIEDGKIVAPKSGVVEGVTRTSSAPQFEIKVKYDGEDESTTIPVKWNTGEPRYTLLFNHYAPGNSFKAGETLAARLDVPKDKEVQIYQEQIGYYEQFVPVIDDFAKLLTAKGHEGVNLRIGEDVCQLDMVACASPHWNPSYLGGSTQSEDEIIDNCVRKNAWAMKQLVQTRPAVLYLVGESSFNMFQSSFGKLIKRKIPLSPHPADGAFSLLRETTDLENPTMFEFETSIDGRKYSISTRLVVSPHFSYNSNFVPQFRMSEDVWEQVKQTSPEAANFLQTDPRIDYIAPEKSGYYLAFQIVKDVAGVFEVLNKQYPDALKILLEGYYDAHKDLAKILDQLYKSGEITYTDPAQGQTGYLTRGQGSCHFCVNEHWSFPLGCPYEKTKEEAPPTGFLEKVSEEIVAAGQ